MRLALASQPVKNGDVDWNVQRMEEALRACRGRADAVVFGESVLQGFDCLSWDYARDCTVAAALTDGPVQRLRAAARENGAAVSFGMIERAGDGLYSSQVFLGADGQLVDVFHRVSVGWKDVLRTDGHYREGEGFRLFSYGGRRFATALCGDLWTPGRPEELAALGADVVLWPVWCDYPAAEWRTGRSSSNMPRRPRAAAARCCL